RQNAEANPLSKDERLSRDEVTCPPYRIAVVHHHPLPIPYDNPLEETMILRNAGAFLTEVAKLGVRLILHGHKHNAHFGRITMNADQSEPHEVGVLAGTTLSRGRRKADGAGYGFNLLTLDDQGYMHVTPYTSLKGGTFDRGDDFPVEQISVSNRRLRHFAADQYGVECALVSSTVRVNPSGDMARRIEYTGFHVLQQDRPCAEMPGGVRVSLTHGRIEELRTGRLGESGPAGMHLVLTEDEPHLKHAEIRFGRMVYATDPPFDYFVEYEAVNGLAMSAHQFLQIHAKS